MTATGTFEQRFPRMLLLWTGVCTASAVPSALIASRASHAGMATGIAVFILAYAVVTSTDAFARFRRDRALRIALKIGFGARLMLSTVLCYPVGMFLDAFPGTAAFFLARAICEEMPFSLRGPDVFGGGPFLPAFLATLFQGVFLNVLLAVFTGIVWLIIRRFIPRSKPSWDECAACGYDLRESPERCPECGTPVPARPLPSEPPRG